MPEANADGALSEGWRVYFRDADFTPVDKDLLKTTILAAHAHPVSCVVHAALVELRRPAPC